MIQDLKYSLRQLWKAPGFTAAAVIVLALGIGANTAVFSIVHTLLFKAPGYANPSELVQLYSQDKKNPSNFRTFSYLTYKDIQQQNTVFTEVMAHNSNMVGVGEKGNTRRTFSGIVSANYFTTLGVTPALGRAFLPDEEDPGKPAQVVVVSDSFWRKQGRKPDLLGSEILINNRPFTVIGIMPRGFTGTTQIVSTDLWLPLSVNHLVTNDFRTDVGSMEDRKVRNLFLVARLKPGLTAASADPALKALAAGIEQANPVEMRDQTFMAGPLPRFATSNRPSNESALSAVGALMLAMAAVVLLVACLNLANMLLARGAARRKEIAIRLAVGAQRRRVVRQLLTEGFVLALIGGMFGIVLALWSSDLLIASVGRLMPIDIVWSTGPNPALLAATFVFCLFGTLAFGLGPALKLSRADVIEDLKDHAGDDVTRRRWKFLPRNPLVVVQFAFSLALVTAAALFIRGANKASNVDTGMQTERMFMVEVDGSLGGLDRQRAAQVYVDIEQQLAALPGVESASIVAVTPFGMMQRGESVQRAGVQAPPDTEPATAAEGRSFGANWNSIGTDYFRTTGARLLRGRSFTAAEASQPGGPAVAIIDEALAKKLWRDGDALGQFIQFVPDRTLALAGEGGDASAGSADQGTGTIRGGEPIEVVGIAPVMRNAVFDKEPGTSIYVPFGRGFQSNIFFFVNFRQLTAGTEQAAADLLRKTIESVQPGMPILALKTFDQHMEANAELWLVRAGAGMFSVFGTLALGLSVIGLYGVKAYSVARRTREIGIRMALGAQRAEVQRMILREGVAMLGTGLVLGLLLAFATGKLVSAMLYEVSSTDPIAFTVAPLVLAFAGLLATWLPARRATRISPMAALRTE